MATSCLVFGGCGTDVNLGGSADAGSVETTTAIAELADLCEPCSSSETCPASASCVHIAGNNTFCGAACPNGTECDADDTCKVVVRAPDGAMVRACLPNSGACSPAKPPTSDGGVIDRCGPLVAPTVTAACTSCDSDDTDCQKNGCYGGWWCNTTTSRCQKPPVSCP